MYQKYYEDVNKIVPYKHAMKKNLKNRMPIYVYIQYAKFYHSLSYCT